MTLLLQAGGFGSDVVSTRCAAAVLVLGHSAGPAQRPAVGDQGVAAAAGDAPRAHPHAGQNSAGRRVQRQDAAHHRSGERRP